MPTQAVLGPQVWILHSLYAQNIGQPEGNAIACHAEQMTEQGKGQYIAVLILCQ